MIIWAGMGKKRKSGPRIGEQTYLAAAREHADLAPKLCTEGHYVAAHYSAGLAVECLLRAYRMRIDPQFDSRHQLDNLRKAARFYADIPAERQPDTAAAMSEVVQLWRNDHRFRSSASLRKWVNRQAAFSWVKNKDVLKMSARRITNAALVVISEGIRRWRKKP